MRNRYYTNFLINEKTDRVIMALDYDRFSDSLRGAIEFSGIDGVRVERVGPLSEGPLFETPGEWEPEAVRNRIAY